VQTDLDMTTPVNAPDFEIAYLGPEGSFAYLVARQRYPGRPLIPFRTVPEVFEHLESHAHHKGIVPIENSSGGSIVPTVDGIIEHACSLFIEEELSLDVKLALMARGRGEIRTIYSHLAPLHHCEPFLKKKYPGAKTVACHSTSASAEAAVREEGAAAIGPINTAEIYGLEVLEYPLREDVQNVTQFFVVGHTRQDASKSEKTSLVVALPNQAGSLYNFLKPFAEAGVNLTRIESRPIGGQPNTYRFLVELHGTENDAPVKTAFKGAEAVSTQFYNVGSYPVLPRYQS
jgi:chorismate mutase/prephenate dehydratase